MKEMNFEDSSGDELQSGEEAEAEDNEGKGSDGDK
jgi:hypothetical protein